MAQIALIGGSYTARSVIAGAQRCVNLYPEKNEEGAPAPYTYLPRPGLTVLADVPTPAPINYGTRCTYTASNGQLFEVIDNNVYYTDASWARHLLGTINIGLSPVFMRDNGTVAVIVDGSASGWVINLTTHSFAAISDAAFYGADRVDYMDTYLIFNRPGTTQIYLSPQNWNGVTAFDALDIANKVGTPDALESLVVAAGQLWLIGTKGSEVWYNAQGVDFPFARVPGVLIQHGTSAKMSVAKADTAIFLLSQDEAGKCIALQGQGYQVKRISTHAIEGEWQGYATVDDAIGFTTQVAGHTFYVLVFPTADKTWVYDMATGFWHEWTWIDDDGIEHRHRANCAAFAYGHPVCGDWAVGALFFFDLTRFTDEKVANAGENPVVYRKGFPHVVKDGKLQGHIMFRLDMQCGAALGLLLNEPPQVMLRWSDGRGVGFCDPQACSFGATGQTDAWAAWWQLGEARDRVYEVFWSAPYKTGVMGAYLDYESLDS